MDEQNIYLTTGYSCIVCELGYVLWLAQESFFIGDSSFEFCNCFADAVGSVGLTSWSCSALIWGNDSFIIVGLIANICKFKDNTWI